jgi:site-specific DNA-methyltransferase (adenine-specific)
MGTLYYGDNLDILWRYLKDETVDLVYLDPPFNSAHKTPKKTAAPPHITASIPTPA